jgi:hypothetical protein
MALVFSSLVDNSRSLGRRRRVGLLLLLALW